MADPNTHDIQAAIDAGEKIAKVEDRIDAIDSKANDGAVPFALLPAGYKIEALMGPLTASDERQPAPREISGTAGHEEVDSFISHVNRFKDERSVVWANIKGVRLLAILDYHNAHGDPRWGRHRAEYACPLSVEWQRWTGQSGKPMTQDAFADFIDANFADLANPSTDKLDDAGCAPPAAVIQMARQLMIRTSGTFGRSINPTTGEFTFENKVENDTTSTKIPRAFLLGIPVFTSGARYRVEARIRFKLSEGKPTFAFELYQADIIQRSAFDDVREQVRQGTGLPMFCGTPE